MLPTHRIRVLRACVAILWLALFCLGFKLFLNLGIPVRHLPRAIKTILRAYGAFGPILILALYIFRSVFFFIPTTVLTLVSGSLYGPFFGTILNVVGENMTASISFGIARLFGRHFVRAHEHGWVKKYDDLLRQEGFLMILFMRTLYFPFDLVNYGSGMTSMTYQQYMLGTFFGLLPPIVTLTILGDAFTNPRALLLFVILFVVTVGGAFFLRRSSWVKRHLYPTHVEENF